MERIYLGHRRGHAAGTPDAVPQLLRVPAVPRGAGLSVGGNPKAVDKPRAKTDRTHHTGCDTGAVTPEWRPATDPRLAADLSQIGGIEQHTTGSSLSSLRSPFLAILARALQTQKSQRAVAIFLQGVSHDVNSGCVPTIVHISRLHGHQVLLQLIEYGHMPLTSSIYDTFFVLQKIVAVQQQGDSDALKPAYESLESFVSQTLTALKRHLKQKHEEMDNCVKKFTARWDNLRKMYVEFFKSYEREMLVRIESNLPAFVEELKQLFTLSLASCDSASNHQLDQLADSAAVVEAKLLEFAEFLAVKAARNISIDAYLEDFPGLVHFMYVNRSSGQMLAPDLRQNNPQLVPKTKLWNMVEFTRGYLKKGQTTVMWKDRTFHYSYFLWFEDLSGGILKCALDLQQHFLSTGFEQTAMDRSHLQSQALCPWTTTVNWPSFAFPN